MRKAQLVGDELLESVARVRLEPGEHRDSRDGVCIVELASILAGEPLSDTPRCVCEVIAAFLRSWNDRLGYADRQRLRPYATRVIETAGDPEATRRRRGILLDFAGVDNSPGLRGLLSRLRFRSRLALHLSAAAALNLDRGAGEYAARLCFGRGDVDGAFALLDLLLGDEGKTAVEVEPRLPGHWVPAIVPDGDAVNGNGNGNGHRDDDGIRATILARRRGEAAHAPANGNGTSGDNGHSARRRSGSRQRH